MELNSYLKIVMHRNGKANLKCDFLPFPFLEPGSRGGALVMEYEAAELKTIEAEIVKIENDKVNWMNWP